MKILQSVLLIIVLMMIVSCGDISVKDVDGNEYKTVKIGNQEWMAENLNVTKYRNGDSIADCWVYNDDENNAITYGRLYAWAAVVDNRNIAPVGWHVPTDEEWIELEMFMGISQADADAELWRGTDQGKKLYSTTGWKTKVNGTDEYGFNALPAGNRTGSGRFKDLSYFATYWSTTESSETRARSRMLAHNESGIFRGSAFKTGGYSVRCIKDQVFEYFITVYGSIKMFRTGAVAPVRDYN